MSLTRLTKADRAEAEAIATDIRTHGGSADRWNRADRTPALSAAVFNLVVGERRTTTAEQLEQFYRYGEMGLMRGGKLWIRPKGGAR